MSRSYKHTPYSGDTKGPDKKRIASKRVRQMIKAWDILPQGKEYKRLYESWNICDYGSIETWAQFWERTLKQWHSWGYKYYPYPDEEKEYRKWYKWNKRK